MPAVNYLTYVKHRKALEEIGDIVTAALDGETTTADEHNKVYISDVNKEIVDEMNEAVKETPEYQLGKRMLRDVSIQFGGDTGVDADYYDENNEEYVDDKVPVITGDRDTDALLEDERINQESDKYIGSSEMVIPNTDYRIEPMKKDILKLIDKVEDLEQMIFNCNAKRRDEYKLINDRITEAFDIIKILERKL